MYNNNIIIAVLMRNVLCCKLAALFHRSRKVSSASILAFDTVFYIYRGLANPLKSCTVTIVEICRITISFIFSSKSFFVEFCQSTWE